MFTALPKTTSILLPSSYKVAFQSVWLAHLRHPLEPTHLKQLLLIIHKQIIPYLNKPQLLMDWLTDSYNSGSSPVHFTDDRREHLTTGFEWSMGVNAEAQSRLSRFLRQTVRIVHPDSISYSISRSLPPTLGSLPFVYVTPRPTITHGRYLPAALVASFIKRLSRLSLSAPPQGVVAILPMIYNLLKRHPTCMQIIHRLNSLPGRPDPFNAKERDPLRTGALESSLWELAVFTPLEVSDCSP
jgi:U3 small nucleolar RNA-associated protein 19